MTNLSALRIVTLLGVLVILSPARAGEVIESRVSSENGRYYIYVEMRIDADPEAVYGVLTDYENIKDLNDSITVSRVLSRDGDKARVLIVSEGCILFFCRQIKQVQEVTPLDRGMILSRSDPETSDLKHGRVLWHVRADDGATRINYSADYAPDFWVPPFFGPPLLRKRMAEEAQKTIQGIERIIGHAH